MNPSNSNAYLRTRVMTASQEELRLLLFDGALKFCRQGLDALSRADWEATYNALTRAQKIIMELSSGLDHSAAPELCERLDALYTYIYRRLVDANMERDSAAVNEAIRLIEYERETWAMVVKKLREEQGKAGAGPAGESTAVPEGGGEAPATVGRIAPGGESTPTSTLSLEG